MAERRLEKADEPLELGSRALDILITLVERTGEVIVLPERFPQIIGHSEHRLIIEMKQTYRGRVYNGRGFVELAAR